MTEKDLKAIRKVVEALKNLEIQVGTGWVKPQPAENN